MKKLATVALTAALACSAQVQAGIQELEKPFAIQAGDNTLNIGLIGHAAPCLLIGIAMVLKTFWWGSLAGTKPTPKVLCGCTKISAQPANPALTALTMWKPVVGQTSYQPIDALVLVRS